MSAIDRIARYVPRDDHEHHCGFFFADDGKCDCGLEERREDVAAVDALYQAAKDEVEFDRGDGMPGNPRLDALADAVRRVEGEQADPDDTPFRAPNLEPHERGLW